MSASVAKFDTRAMMIIAAIIEVFFILILSFLD